MCCSWKNQRNYDGLWLLLTWASHSKWLRLLPQAIAKRNGQIRSLVRRNGLSRSSSSQSKRRKEVYGHDKAQREGEMIVIMCDIINRKSLNHPELSKVNSFWKPYLPNGSSISYVNLCWISLLSSLVFIKLSCSYLSKDRIWSKSLVILASDCSSLFKLESNNLRARYTPFSLKRSRFCSSSL